MPSDEQRVGRLTEAVGAHHNQGEENAATTPCILREIGRWSRRDRFSLERNRGSRRPIPGRLLV